MESWFTFLARIVVIAFVAVVVSAVITPTATRLASSLSQSADEPAEVVTRQAERPVVNSTFLSAIIGVAVFGVCLAGSQLWQIQKFKKVEQAIETLDGHISFSPDFSSAFLRHLYSKTTLDLSGTNLTDANFPDIFYLPRLRTLRISSTGVSDEVSSAIAKCRQLQSLDISDTNLSDHSVAWFSNLACLETLIATGSKITDDSELFSQFPKLKKLEFN